jgi:phage tail protein X
MRIISLQGDTVDLVCWRVYGRTHGALEAVFAANPGLADYGVVLPLGTVIEMPELAHASPSTPLLQLFD